MLGSKGAGKSRLQQMADTTDKRLIRGVNSVVPPALLAAVSMMLLVTASDYGETARQLPVLIGGSVFILTILDLVSRLPGRLGEFLHVALGAGFDDSELGFTPRWTREVAQIAWVAAIVAGIVCFGFLVAIPVFVLLYTRVHGRWPLWLGALAAAATAGVVALVFEWLLDYRLYRGIVFGAEFYV